MRETSGMVLQNFNKHVPATTLATAANRLIRLNRQREAIPVAKSIVDEIVWPRWVGERHFLESNRSLHLTWLQSFVTEWIGIVERLIDHSEDASRGSKTLFL